MSFRFASRLSALVGTLALMSTNAWAGMCPAFLNHDFTKLHSSETVNICKVYAGKPLLIVNTASHCGYTPQSRDLKRSMRSSRAAVSW